jgi:hypothetical protein
MAVFTAILYMETGGRNSHFVRFFLALASVNLNFQPGGSIKMRFALIFVRPLAIKWIMA